MALLTLNSYKYLVTHSLLTTTTSYINWFEDYGMGDYYGNGTMLVWNTNDEYDPYDHSSYTDNGGAQSWYYWLAADYCRELIPYVYMPESKKLCMELPLMLDNGLENISDYGLRWTAGFLEHKYPDANQIELYLGLINGTLDLLVRVPDQWNIVSLEVDGVWQESLKPQTDDFDIAFNDSYSTYLSSNDANGQFGDPTLLLTTSDSNITSVKGMDFGNINGNGRNDLVLCLY